MPARSLATLRWRARRARLLVLTHFSQRYEHDDDQRLAAQAAAAFGGPVVLAHDLDRIPVPSRHPSAI